MSKSPILRLMSMEWFDEAAVSRVLENTDLPLRDGVAPARLQQFLSELTNQSVGVQLSGLRTSKEWQRVMSLLDSILEYDKVSTDWARSGEFLPRIQPGTIGNIAALRDQLRSEHNDPAVVFRRRIGVWMDYFFPRCLGLYGATFGDEPKSTLDLETGARTHPTVHFVATVLREASIMQKDLGYAEELAWPMMELGTVASRIAEYKRQRHPQHPEKEVWRGHRDEYLIRMQISEINI